MNLLLVQGSGLLHSIGYDGSNKLEIRFVSTPSIRYIYSNVTPDVFAKFVSAESMGKWFVQTIKGNAAAYPFVKVAELKEENQPQGLEKVLGESIKKPRQTKIKFVK